MAFSARADMQTKELRSSVTFLARADCKSTGCKKFTLNGRSTPARFKPQDVNKSGPLDGILVMVMDYKLTYPSGTATAMFDKQLPSLQGKQWMIYEVKQVRCLGKYLSLSLCWSCFKWFFSGIGDSCGFDNFPTLGLTLFKNT
ncbi:hypothetical protein HYC85_005863 [Camellia sinensis]|uniref:Uncharacterized protein n=1 Tax=Camellia sinensis TaxID=4442 RepID=A0A7J7I3B0_CAMSI|nr:hypothetical protein HYC85_005863 [Camellia sinensis]